MKKWIAIFGLIVLAVLPVWGQQREALSKPKRAGGLFPIYLEENMFRTRSLDTYAKAWGYIDSSGKVIIPPQFSAAGHFSEGLAPVREGSPTPKTVSPGLDVTGGAAPVLTRKWGYINEAGQMIIKPRFDAAGIFSEGLARIAVDGKFGFIDKLGKVIINPRFDEVGAFSYGLALVRVGNKYGYMNQFGQVVIEPRFDDASSFSEELAAVRIGNQYGYIDRTGRTVIEPRFAGAVSFAEGLARVKANSKWGYIDKAGKFIIQPQFEEGGSFAEGLAEIKIGANWGYINRTGRIIIQPQFREADSFSQGLASVKINDQWGYINKQGKIKIAPQYLSAKPFYKGIGVVTQYESVAFEAGTANYEIWVYIDVKGKELARQRKHIDGIGHADFIFYAQVEISLWSRPTGAIVYLIPLYDWENDPDIVKDDKKLSRHRVPQGNTDVKTKLPEKVFVAVFVLNDCRIAINVDVTQGGDDSFGVQCR